MRAADSKVVGCFPSEIDIEEKTGFQSAEQFVSQISSTDVVQFAHVVQIALYYSTDSGLAS